MTIGEKIRITRKAAKMTQKDFADITGFAVNTISRYETGERATSWDSITQIASAFGMSAAELLSGVDEYAQNAINDLLKPTLCILVCYLLSIV